MLQGYDSRAVACTGMGVSRKTDIGGERWGMMDRPAPAVLKMGLPVLAGLLAFGRALAMWLVRELKVDRAGKLRQRRKHRGAKTFDLQRGGVVVRNHENVHRLLLPRRGCR